MSLCDCSLARVVLTGRSEPLDVGRRTPVVPASMRRAVIVRDRHCRFPGCDRPQSWCDAHHVVHWINGGQTALSNLVLLCRRHHRLIHHKRFSVEMADGLPRFYRSDGTVLEAADRAPP
jgi:HNH endonuclease